MWHVYKPAKNRSSLCEGRDWCTITEPRGETAPRKGIRQGAARGEVEPETTKQSARLGRNRQNQTRESRSFGKSQVWELMTQVGWTVAIVPQQTGLTNKRIVVTVKHVTGKCVTFPSKPLSSTPSNKNCCIQFEELFQVLCGPSQEKENIKQKTNQKAVQPTVFLLPGVKLGGGSVMVWAATS